MKKDTMGDRLLEAMQCAPSFRADALAQRLDLADLDRLHHRLRTRGSIPRGVVMELARGSADIDASGRLVAKPGDEDRLDVLVELGRVSQAAREASVSRAWEALGLTELQEHAIAFMPHHRDHDDGWLEHLFARLRQAGWLEADEVPSHLDDRPVKVMLAEFGASDGDVEVEIEICLDVPPSATIRFRAERECAWHLSSEAASELHLKVMAERAARRGRSHP